MTGQLDMRVVTGIGMMHVLALAACIPYFFTWSGVIICFALQVFFTLFGINICYHRLLTHRSFKTPKWFEYLLTIIAVFNWQGGPISWTGTHRIHHQHSDKPGDPHTPQDGFTWAHVFWVMFKCPEGVDPKAAAGDLVKDRGMRFIDEFFWVPQLILIPILLFLGFFWHKNWTAGVSWVIWGIGVRTVLSYHFTWFVNSASHVWGYQTFKGNDNSQNNWWVAILSFGEGWHNNHHALQTSARHGLKWYEIDITYYTIKILGFIGLVWDIKVPKEEEVLRRKITTAVETT